MARPVSKKMKAHLQTLAKKQHEESHLGDIKLSTKQWVRWTNEEWDDLAHRVHRKRKRHPEMKLWDLVNAVQQQSDDPSKGITAWPEMRRRKVNSLHQVEPILSRLRDLDIEIQQKIDGIQSLHDTIETLRAKPDKETLLASLTPEEIQRRFQASVLDNLTPAEILGRFEPRQILAAVALPQIFAFVAEQLVGGLQSLENRFHAHLEEHRTIKPTVVTVNGHNGHGQVNGHHVTNVHKPRIAFIGFQQNHVPKLVNHFGPNRAEFLVLSKNDTNWPHNLDHVVLWEDHATGHIKQMVKKEFPNGVLTVHRGTFDDLLKSNSIPCLARRPK